MLPEWDITSVKYACSGANHCEKDIMLTEWDVTLEQKTTKKQIKDGFMLYEWPKILKYARSGVKRHENRIICLLSG